MKNELQTLCITHEILKKAY